MEKADGVYKTGFVVPGARDDWSMRESWVLDGSRLIFVKSRRPRAVQGNAKRQGKQLVMMVV